MVNFSCRLVCLVAAACVANEVEATNYTINGDTTTKLQYSVHPGPPGQPNSITMCYAMVGKPAGSTWSVHGSTATTGSVILTYPDTAGVSVTTSGISPPGNSSSQYISIGYALGGLGGGGCTPGSDTDFFVVDPTISLSGSSATGALTGNPLNVPLNPPSLNSSAYAVTATLSPPAAGLTITGTCAGTNGPTFSSANQSMTVKTNLGGTAPAFPTVTANNVVVVHALSAPTATCSFSVGGTHTAALTYTTMNFDPILTVTYPTSPIAVSGTSAVSVNANVSYSGIQMLASCNNSSLPAGSSVTVSPSSIGMGNPVTSFSVSTTKLDFINSNTSTPLPTPSCTFSVPNGTHTATINIQTANLCTPSLLLSPRPPGC